MRDFCIIAASLILILKISSIIELEKTLLFLSMTKDAEIRSGAYNNKDKTVKRLLSKKSNKVSDYLNYNSKKIFFQLRQAFIKALIFQHLELDYYI